MHEFSATLGDSFVSFHSLAPCFPAEIQCSSEIHFARAPAAIIVAGRSCTRYYVLSATALSQRVNCSSDNSSVTDDAFVLISLFRFLPTVSTKALAGAKSLGGFLYSAVNKAGKTVVEASAKIKKTVEENVSFCTVTLVIL